MEKTYTEIVSEVLKSKKTSYSIGQATGIKPQILDRYRNGDSKIENMSLKNAEAIVKYAQTAPKTISSNKSQWLGMARLMGDAKSAKEFLGTHIYAYTTKESALNAFKHEIKKREINKRSLKGETNKLGTPPEELVPWLSELTVDDVADR